MLRKMLKASVALAITGIAVLVAPSAAQAAMVYKTGTVSCNYGYHGTVKTYTEMDVDGLAPGGASFSFKWGTWTWQTHFKTGAISGSWLAESSGSMDMDRTYATCS